NLGVRRGVQVTAVLLHDQAFQLLGIDQITVVRQADAVRGIDVERLSFGEARTAGSRVTYVPKPYVAAQTQHMTVLEDVAHEPVALARMQLPVLFGHDAGGILAAMLQHGQRVVQALVDRFLPDYSYDSTHVSILPCLGLAKKQLPISAAYW